MKEPFVRMKNETKKNIEKQFLEVLTKKMEVFDILQKIKEQYLPNIIKYIFYTYIFDRIKIIIHK